ncbi:phosphonate C-P lyase system protein PhnH [bacterium]|nr:phosphonate C-P lyase system protein PhnH [bacterium]
MIENKSFNQLNFRTLLNCMSLPGTIGILECDPEDKKNPLVSLYLCAQVLLDPEVSFFVSGIGLDNVSKEIATTTKAFLSTNESADYLFLLNEDLPTKIERAKKGSMESPEKGATCLIYIPTISQEPSSYVLTGPGIENFTLFPTIEHLNMPMFYQAFAKVNSEFPLGIDFIFIDSWLQIFCIPRTVKMKRKV